MDSPHVCLIRPSSGGKGYGALVGERALEPPHWILVRAAWLRMQGAEVSVVDMERQSQEDIPEADEYEIWPTGAHPAAYVQEQEGVADLVHSLFGRMLWVKSQVDFPLTGVSPAWDLVDPRDYSTHNWHSWTGEGRQGYGTVHGSASCPYGCSFCSVRGYYGGGYKPRPVGESVVDITRLYDMGVRNIKMMDELFVVDDARLAEWADAIMEQGFVGLNVWAYGRVDTLRKVKDSTLVMAREAGLRWVGVGFESGDMGIRMTQGKGTWSNSDAMTLRKRLKDAGIAIVGNYMFGFPNDTYETMRATFEFAYAMQTELANFYCVVAYPKTPLESMAKSKGWELPKTPREYAQYAPEFRPLPTDSLSAQEVLAYRDWAWHGYHGSSGYLWMLGETFGVEARAEMERVGQIPLHRNLLGGTWEDWNGRK